MNASHGHNLATLRREFEEARDKVLRDWSLPHKEREAQLRQIQEEYYWRRDELEGIRGPAAQEGQGEARDSLEGGPGLARILATKRRRRHWK